MVGKRVRAEKTNSKQRGTGFLSEIPVLGHPFATVRLMTEPRMSGVSVPPTVAVGDGLAPLQPMLSDCLPTVSRLYFAIFCCRAF